ncbi:MAG: TadE family protein [bacterium]
MTRPRQKGAGIVEFALILPLFLLLIMGILEFGSYFFVQHTLQYATREGMRLGLVGGRLPNGHGGYLTREESIIQAVREEASLAVNSANISVYVYPVLTDYQDPTNWQDLPPNAGDPGVYMRVRTRYTLRFITPLIAAFFPGGQIIVEAQGTYRNELFDA